MPVVDNWSTRLAWIFLEQSKGFVLHYEAYCLYIYTSVGAAVLIDRLSESDVGQVSV